MSDTLARLAVYIYIKIVCYGNGIQGSESFLRANLNGPMIIIIIYSVCGHLGMVGILWQQMFFLLQYFLSWIMRRQSNLCHNRNYHLSSHNHIVLITSFNYNIKSIHCSYNNYDQGWHRWPTYIYRDLHHFLKISVEIQSRVWEEKIPVGKICRQQEITVQNKSAQI